MSKPAFNKNLKKLPLLRTTQYSYDKVERDVRTILMSAENFVEDITNYIDEENNYHARRMIRLLQYRPDCIEIASHLLKDDDVKNNLITLEQTVRKSGSNLPCDSMEYIQSLQRVTTFQHENPLPHNYRVVRDRIKNDEKESEFYLPSR